MIRRALRRLVAWWQRGRWTPPLPDPVSMAWRQEHYRTQGTNRWS